MERTSLTAVAPRERTDALDIIRGVALFGVLLVNMMVFRMDFRGVFMLVPGLSGLAGEIPFWDQVATWTISGLVAGRCVSILSILFGLGCYMIMERADQKGRSFRRVLWRRLWLLMVFGILHYVFIWEGDILYSFAVTGVVLLLFMRLHLSSLRKWLIGFGIVWVLATGGLFALVPWLMEAMGQFTPEMMNAMKGLLEGLPALLLQQSYWGAVLTRAMTVPFLLFAPLLFLFFLLPLFLVGLYAGKAGIVDSLVRGEGPFSRALLPTLISAVLGLGLSAWIPFVTDNPLAWALAGVLALIGWGGSLLFYICALILLARSTLFGWLLRPFIPVGQMSMTTYLMQSVIATLIFQGYGLGLAGQVGAGDGVLLTIGIFAGQMIFSWLWLKRFAFGPAEWLWRRLMYGRGILFRLPATDA